MTGYRNAFGKGTLGDQASVVLDAANPALVTRYNLTFTGVIPEPTSVAALGLFAALGLVRRRR
jgi:hypothetical protein